MFKLDGADVKATDLYFICVEAKRQQTVDEQSSKAQLLAQIRALQIQRFFRYFKNHLSQIGIINQEQVPLLTVLNGRSGTIIMEVGILSNSTQDLLMRRCEY